MAITAFILTLAGAAVYLAVQVLFSIIVTPICLVTVAACFDTTIYPIGLYASMGVGMAVICVLSFIASWISTLALIVLVAGMTLGVLALVTSVKETGRGGLLSIVSVVIGGLVLLAIVCGAIFNIISTVLAVFLFFVFLTLAFIILLA